jgi:hypothetical protein
MLGGHANREEIGEDEESKAELQGITPAQDKNKAEALEGQAVKYDWCNKWLKGDEYYHILKHTELYAKVYNFKKYPPKTHPQTTYTNPTSTINLLSLLDGEIYFVEGLSVGSEFGFPRVNMKKRYKWYSLTF